jgi:hypothetical protein
MRHEPGGYERTDASAGGAFRAGLYVLAMMFVTALLVVPFYRLLRSGETAAQPPATEVVESAVSEPVATFPRLVESEPQVLGAFRAQEDALLTSYGWVEKDKGLARIPIDEAMKLVASRGMPKFQAAAPAADGGKR